MGIKLKKGTFKVKKNGTFVPVDVLMGSGDGESVLPTDVRINGTSITTDGVANIPVATASKYGAVKVDGALSPQSPNPVQNKAVVAAISTRVAAVAGKGLSTNDYTDEDKAKVDAIPSDLDASLSTVKQGLSELDSKFSESIAEISDDTFEQRYVVEPFKNTTNKRYGGSYGQDSILLKDGIDTTALRGKKITIHANCSVSPSISCNIRVIENDSNGGRLSTTNINDGDKKEITLSANSSVILIYCMVFNVQANVDYAVSSSVSIKLVDRDLNSDIRVPYLDAEIENIRLDSYASEYHTQEEAYVDNTNQIKGWNNLIFTTVTDSHLGGYNIPEEIMEKHASVYADLSSILGSEFLIHLGDMSHEKVYDASVSQQSENRRRLNTYMKHIKNTHVPFLYTLGHHEMYPWGASVALGIQTVWGMCGKYGKWLRQRMTQEYMSRPTYYYVDFAEYAMRVIITNSCDGNPIEWGVDQLKWLKNTALKNVPSGYGVVLFGHSAPVKSISNIDTDNIYNGYSKDGLKSQDNSDNLFFFDILKDAYNSGVNIIAYIHGHNHCDNVWNVEGVGFPCISINCDNPHKYPIRNGCNGEPYNAYRVLGEYSEYCADTFAINKDARTIYVRRFGGGHNRRIWCTTYECSVGGTVTIPFNNGHSVDIGIASINGTTVTGVSVGTTQIIYDSGSEKYYCSVKVS